MKGKIVFDFDKTLTGKDTLLGFYRESASGFMFHLKYPFLLLSAILFKAGLISNDSLKRVGVILYLKGLRKRDLEKIALRYSSKINLNNIYHNDFLKYSPERVLIISASFEVYLKPLFRNYTVVGSRLQYDNENRVNGMITNMYGEKKREWLLNQNIDRVEVFYTDSHSDQPIIDLSNKVYMIKNNKKRQLS